MNTFTIHSLRNNDLEHFSCNIYLFYCFITWDRFYRNLCEKFSFILLLPARISRYHQFLFQKFMHFRKQTIPVTWNLSEAANLRVWKSHTISHWSFPYSSNKNLNVRCHNKSLAFYVTKWIKISISPIRAICVWQTVYTSSGSVSFLYWWQTLRNTSARSARETLRYLASPA